MKQTLLAALLAAVAASALTLLLAEGLRPASGGASAAEFKAALGDLVGEVAALRREMAAGRGGTPAPAPAPAATDRLPPVEAAPGFAPAAPAGEVPAPVPAPGSEDVPAMEDFVPREERSAIPRSPELVEKLRGLTKWEESADIRRVWILAGEDAVVASFGKPDEIYIQDGGQECWNFRTQTGTRDENGDPEWQDITIEMNRGRLVRVYD